ncbi:MAG: ChaN family lipoprotein, partial [Desulfobacteraceae bacterium]|nr:ChaN family lipoprotein [Desulfobacteraceae bacterium]
MASRFFPETLFNETGTLCLVSLLGFALFALAGCAVTGGVARFSTHPAEPGELAIGEVVETETARRLSFDEMMDRLPGASVVYVGETHTSTEDHRAQLEILQRLARSGECVELGMEMFPRTAQPVLDRYVRGEMSEEEFLKEVRWDEVWGFPFQLYRGLVDFARSRRIRIIGLNAPQEVVRRIARVGLSGLEPGERAQIGREFHLDDPENR